MSLGSGSGTSLVLYIKGVLEQISATVSNNLTTLPDLMKWQTTPVVYSNTDTTFDGATSKFTVKTTGSSLINIQILSGNPAYYLMLNMNDGGWPGSVIGFAYVNWVFWAGLFTLNVVSECQ